MTNMSKEHIRSTLIREVSVILGIAQDTIAVDAPLHSLGFDSLSFVELLVAIEKKLNIKLMESSLSKDDFKSIDSLAECISKIK